MKKLIEIAQVGKPHGLKGCFFIYTGSGIHSLLTSLRIISIGETENTAQEFELLETHWNQKAWRVRVKGIQSVEQAKALQGCKVFTERQELPELVPGEYYLSDLVGMSAIDSESGDQIGSLKGVEFPTEIHVSPNTPDYALRWWFIGDGGIPFAIPPSTKYIRNVDLSSGKIFLHNLAELEQDEPE